jgi:sterol desaturase/sphingolipid hydroxylase (fatty acid hydroxylase superfamily)
VLCAWSTQVIAWTTYNLILTPIYAFDWCRRYRISRTPWLWQRGAAEASRFRGLVARSLGISAFNFFVLSPLLTWRTFPLLERLGGYSDSLEAWPTATTLLWQLSLFMVVEDTIFYWFHRTLHAVPFLYRNVHKVHHVYHANTVGYAVIHAHPVEFVFGNGLPTAAGPLLVAALGGAGVGPGLHAITFAVWSLWRLTEGVDGHAGFDWPWAPTRVLPFSASSASHDFHHAQIVGCYASFFGWWDALMGSDAAFVAHVKAAGHVTSPGYHLDDGRRADAAAVDDRVAPERTKGAKAE